VTRISAIGSLQFAFVLLAFCGVVSISCRRAPAAVPPVATPMVTINRDRAALGSPIDVTYRFVVASDARIADNCRVMVHVLDVDEQMIFALDHDPPVATTQWKPGQTIEYTRTEFIPIYPYVGVASMQVGLYSPASQKRLPLSGTDTGQHAYKVAQLQILPQTDNVYTVFHDGWHPAETAEHNAKVEWQWTKKDATMSFKNPRKDSIFYFDLDNPRGAFKDPQQVQVEIGGQTLDTLMVTPGNPPALHKIPIKAAQLGDADMVDLKIHVDRTFVPAETVPGSKDPRELGVRVFHAFIQPTS
jgi:hypothetical protein